MSKADRPWMKFYPADWRSDPKLRICPLAARGLWIDMLALMHEASPYGHLLVAGQPVTDDELAALVGAPSDLVSDCLRKLEAAGVFSRTRKGVIYSRRMVRDEKKAAEARTTGTSGGNPKLKGDYRMAGFVYLMGVRSDGSYKIGASVNPKNRVKKVRAQYPQDDIRVLGQWYVDEMGTMEATLHRTFSKKGRGEWFVLTPQDIESIPLILDPKGTAKGGPLPQRPEARSQNISPSLRSGEDPPDQRPASGKPDLQVVAPSRGQRLPRDWVLPPDWERWARQEGHFDPVREAEKFRDYWVAKAGAGGVKLDWQATWRTWVRRSLEDAARKQGRRGGQNTGSDERGIAGFAGALARRMET